MLVLGLALVVAGAGCPSTASPPSPKDDAGTGATGLGPDLAAPDSARSAAPTKASTGDARGSTDSASAASDPHVADAGSLLSDDAARANQPAAGTDAVTQGVADSLPAVPQGDAGAVWPDTPLAAPDAQGSGSEVRALPDPVAVSSPDAWAGAPDNVPDNAPELVPSPSLAQDALAAGPEASADVWTADTIPAVVAEPGVVTGSANGLSAGESAIVVLGNDKVLYSQKVGMNGTYRFSGVPDGTYFLKISAAGYAAGRARTIVMMAGAQALQLGAQDVDTPLVNPDSVDFDLAPVASDVFTYHWEEDPSRGGYEATAHIVQPPVVTFLDQPVTTPEVAPAPLLLGQFDILLSDGDVPWSSEYAYRLLDTVRDIPQPERRNEGEVALVPSKWTLTSRHIDGDIEVSYSPSGNQVTISADAFVYATPRLALVDGQRGRFFSKRLHHALVSYLTHQGNDLVAVEKILQARYGCTTQIPDYKVLTAQTTNEDAAHFQAFHPAELVELINMYEEMPDGFHKVPGLKYLVRRVDGQVNPTYPTAAAVAWAWPAVFPDGSYIEFMDPAFSTSLNDTHRLILHEKAHFLWGYVFSSTLKQDWTTLGGWYPNSNDPDGWSTSKTTEFVTAYAHKKNPDEDMAESMAYFVLDPAALQARAMEKYEFIRDRIMQGTRYLSRIQQDLTFEVLDLYPDYDYPGKIARVDIKVDGAPSADKTVTIEIELQTDAKVFAGASQAYFRLYSPINTYVDVYLMPTDSTGAVLRGQFSISKYAKTGYWMTDQIVVTDSVGNQRFEGVNDYGWKLYINNPDEDVIKPKFVAGSMNVQLVQDTLVANGVSHPIQRVDVRWGIDENNAVDSVYAKLSNPSMPNMYPLEAYGTFDVASKTALVSFDITEFMPQGTYGVPYVFMKDLAGNLGDQSFSSSTKDEPLASVAIATANPDTTPPEVSLNDDVAHNLHRILISAQPTNPDHPNGETLVDLTYQARDDKSGVGVVAYTLRDPQGGSHMQYHYHSNFYTPYFVGDATAWADYHVSVVLPVGSPPGTWGLESLSVRDKANNIHNYNFVEIVQFQVGQ
jgi:hypothetical protein